MEESESISEENGEENKEIKVTMPTAINHSLPIYTSMGNLILQPTATEIFYNPLNSLPVYTFPKTTMMAPMANINNSLPSNSVAQPASIAVPNTQIGYSPQVSNVQTIENLIPIQLPFSTTQASTPLNQANSINNASNIEASSCSNQQLFQMIISMQQQQHEINRQNVETINYLKETINQMNVMIHDLLNTRRSKVIPPGKYRSDGGEPLLVYLKRFEEYVKHTYPGSQSGMTFLLENYL